MPTETEREIKESLSFKDLILSEADESGKLRDFLNELENQDEILGSIESETEVTSLIDSIENLEGFDPEISNELKKYLISLIKSGAFSPDAIPKLILNIETESEASESLREKYGADRGAITWDNYQLRFHDALKERDAEGRLKYDLSHFVGHEIGHSLFEADAISTEEIRELFDGTNTEYESGHIQHLIDAGADDDLILKERFSELVGIYLNSKGEKYPESAFIQRRAGKSTMSEIDTNPKGEFAIETMALYKKISALWPKISQRIEEVELESHLEEILGAYGDFGEELMPGMEELEPGEETPDLDQGSSEILDQEKKQGYSETGNLGKEEKHDESFFESTNKLVAAMAAEFDFITPHIS